MADIKLPSTICILILSSYSMSIGQEFQFQREIDTIPVIVDGANIPLPFVGAIVIDSSKPTLADIDDDGDFDLLVGETAGNVNFFRNIGISTDSIPTFILVTEYLDSIDVGFNSTPTLVDIDSDGDLDLFVGASAGNINFFRNIGTPTDSIPTFTLETENFASINVRGGNTPTFADIDNDGDFDLFVGKGDSTISFYRNTGTVTNPIFTLVIENFASINVGITSTPTFTDIDNDGDLDLFVGELDGNISFYRNTGTATEPTFTLETETFADIDVGFFSAPTFADIDNDGDFDLFVGEGSDPFLAVSKGNVYFYRNTGTATNADFLFEISNLTSDIVFGHIPTFADIDDDGDYDLFMGGGDGNINFYKNTGTASEPTFTLVTKNLDSIDVGDSSAPTFADIDDDGDFDLFAGELDGKIVFYQNTGTASDPMFTLVSGEIDSIDVGFFSAPTFTDIDNDRDFDMFVGNFAGNIHFYRNTGTVMNPVFTLEATNVADIDVGMGSSPTFVDIDDDGDFDLYVGENDGNINFYRNTGTSTNPVFTLETESFASIHIGICCSAPTFIDIDNDGDSDLFAGESAGGLHFYRNVTPLRGDINKDGKVDVADLIRVIDIILGTPPEPTDEEKAAADVNSDGNIDVRDLIVITNIILGIGLKS